MLTQDRAQALWGLRGLGPEAKLFVLALARTDGDVARAASLAELKQGQGELFERMLLDMGLVSRPNGNGRIVLTPEALETT